MDDDAFQWAKRHAWIEWERKHTICGMRVQVDPSLLPGEIRFQPNRFSFPMLTMTHGRVHMMDDVLLNRDPEGWDG